MTTEQKTLLEIVKIGVTGECLVSEAVFDADWEKLYDLACTQGMTSVAWHGLETLYKHGVDKCPQEVKLQWYGRDKQVKAENTKNRSLIVEFGELMKPLQLAVLKGVDYAQYWPVASWREFGDLDCVAIGDGLRLFKGLRVQDCGKLLDEKAVDAGCTFDEGDYKHSKIQYKSLTVENHHTFTSFVGAKEAYLCEVEMQKLFRSGDVRELEGTPLYSPNVNFTAAFLIAHSQNHFFSEEMNLRMLLDWLFFLRKEGKRVDWQTVNGVLERIGSLRFAVMLTEFCVQYLGLDSRLQQEAGLTLTAGGGEERDVVELREEIFNGKRHNTSDRRLWSIIRRKIDNYVHIWHFRHLMRMPVHKAIWQSIAYNSYFNRHPKF